MDFKNKSSLVKKYWQAETNLEEEGRLKENLSDKDKLLSPEEVQYFEQVQQFSELQLAPEFEQQLLAKLEEKKDNNIRRLLYIHASKIAASLLLIIASMVGFSYWSAQEAAKDAETREAFEMARQSLLLMSSQLNKGTSSTYNISKFSSTQQKIKGK